MTISIKQVIQGVAILALAGAQAGCGGGGSATIGGTVSGMTTGATVTLQDNNADNLTIFGDQGFSFPTTIAAGSAYNVSVLAQPVGENCVMGNGAGTVDSFGDDVSDVTVTCSMTSSVGGTVAGLAVGNSVWLSLNNGVLLPIATNGQFAFPGILVAGSNYSISVSTQPAQQNCVVVNGTGVVSSGAMASVAVSCT